jgi:hypothetical protein
LARNVDDDWLGYMLAGIVVCGVVSKRVACWHVCCVAGRVCSIHTTRDLCKACSTAAGRPADKSSMLHTVLSWLLVVVAVHIDLARCVSGASWWQPLLISSSSMLVIMHLCPRLESCANDRVAGRQRLVWGTSQFSTAIAAVTTAWRSWIMSWSHVQQGPADLVSGAIFGGLKCMWFLVVEAPKSALFCVACGVHDTLATQESGLWC